MLPKMKDGNPSRGTLLQKDAAGRIPEDLWRALVSNPELRTELAQNLLHSFWPESLHEAIKPKAPFRPVFQVATTREGSGVALVHDPDAKPQTADQPPPGGQEADGVSCSWWRRGRIGLHLEHGTRVMLAA